MAANKSQPTTTAERAAKRTARKAAQQEHTAAVIAAMKPEDQLRLNTVLAARQARLAEGYKANTAITLSPEREAQLAQWAVLDAANSAVLMAWGKRLAHTHKQVHKLDKQYRDLLYGFIQEAYAVYCEVDTHELSDKFYANVRGALLDQGIKMQGNTPNAAMVVRLVFGADADKKSISEYSKVMQAAAQQRIEPDRFAAWLKQNTITKVLAVQRAAVKELETPKDKLQRARIMILRLLDIRETKPIITHTTTAHTAEKLLGRHHGLCVAIGHASRHMDRNSFYADVNLSMVLPVSLDFEIMIVDKLARYILHNLEYHESQILSLEEHVWADQLYQQLVAAGDAEVDAHAQRWAARQQSVL